MQIIATQKFVRTSPKKLRVIVSMVKNLKPVQAIEVLPHLDKKTQDLIKVIKTAVANAKQKGLSDADLIFKEIQVNDGPRLKRWRAGARGLVKPYKRRMSHIRVILETKEPEVIQKAREEIESGKHEDPNLKSETNSNVQNTKPKTREKNV